VAKKTCQICGQKTDIYTSVHKKSPFVDGRNYDCVCFTCFFVPKVAEQKYRKDGSLDEESPLPYSCSNLNSPKDLHGQGSAETLRQAKACVEAVERACRGVRPPKKPMNRPEASWNVC
jgi:hypothetical protein